jgi:hypothetical protein
VTASIPRRQLNSLSPPARAAFDELCYLHDLRAHFCGRSYWGPFDFWSAEQGWHWEQGWPNGYEPLTSPELERIRSIRAAAEEQWRDTN